MGNGVEELLIEENIEEKEVDEAVLLDLLSRIERTLENDSSEVDPSFLLPSIREEVPPVFFPEGEVHYPLSPPLKLPPLLCWLISGSFLQLRITRVKARGGILTVEVELDDGSSKTFSSQRMEGGKRDLFVIFSLWLLLKRRYGVDFLEDLIREGRKNFERIHRFREAAEKVRALALLLR